jgi:outer membrane protein TolC
MHASPHDPRRTVARLLRRLAAPTLLIACGAAAADGPPEAAPPPRVAAPAPVVVADVRTARQIAVERQPAVAAARASLAAAEARCESLERLRVPTLLARDLPTRRHQAALGVDAARAALQQAEADAAYAATYAWLAVQYAREQQATAADAKERLGKLRTAVEERIKDRKRRDIRAEHRDLLDSVVRLIEGRTSEAQLGEERALAALREALGLGPGCVVVVPARRLPLPPAPPDRDTVVHLALARRGEAAQAAVAAAVSHLEIDAQRATCLPTARTFAAGSDIHATPVPPADKGPNYKPGGVPPEMPTTMNGPRSGRVDQAAAYADRADAVAEKTRNLIALEAEEAWLRAREQAALYDRLGAAYRSGQKYADDLQLKFDEPVGTYPSVEDLLGVGQAVARYQTESREAHFRYLVNLAVLERATGGALCIDFDVPPPPNGNGAGK